MNRRALALSLAALVLVVMSQAALSDVEAADTDYIIARIDHQIEVMYNGYIFINDTVQLENVTSRDFRIGVPYQYGPHILSVSAHNSTSRLPITTNVPLEGEAGIQAGFYGVGIEIPDISPQVINVCFVLSNNLLTQNPANASLFTLSFPEFPSLTKETLNCSASVSLPPGSSLQGGSISALKYDQESLPPFFESTASIIFQAAENELRVIDIEEVRRVIEVSEADDIKASDFYALTNKASQSITSVEVTLLQDADNPSAYDQLGRILNVDATGEANTYEVNFTQSLEMGKSTGFTVGYSLPLESYISQGNTLNLTVFKGIDYYISQFSLEVVLPEGSGLVTYEDISKFDSYSITRSVFQETLTLNKKGAFHIHDFVFTLTYKHSLLWVSFRPTLWMLAITVVGSVVAAIWSRSRSALPISLPKALARATPQEIKSFVGNYEKKRKTLSEIESLKSRVGRGKIPRRRYKVRMKTLETRLNALDRHLNELREKSRDAGGEHADLMHRLEIAETRIDEVEGNILSIQTRHRRGDLSLGAYRKLRLDYEKRKEKAEATIDEILIRLREETL